MQLEWHAGHSHLQDLALLDRDPAEREIDMVSVRGYRLNRVRQEMANYGVDCSILTDPVNIRYATGARNMQVFCARNQPSRYVFIPLNGPVILFEFTGCEHLGEGIETIDEVRQARTASFVAAGAAIGQTERLWAREMGDLIRQHCGTNAVVGIERINAGATIALGGEGFHIVDAQQPVEMARAIKSAEEIKCAVSSIRATERAVGVMRDAIRPGMTEQQLWSILHQQVISQGGDYVETRLLSAGERTNPWFQEASDHVIGRNQLVALDTDVVGCFGYYADFSRTFHAGPDKPTDKQKAMYKTALEQIYHNMDIIRAGVTFKEYSEKAWNIPKQYEANRYYLSSHGVGMTGEYPYLYHKRDYEVAGYDGVILPNMTICVESYIGEEGGAEGVKMEQHCLVTENGLEILSQFPFEAELADDSIHLLPNIPLIQRHQSFQQQDTIAGAVAKAGVTNHPPSIEDSIAQLAHNKCGVSEADYQQAKQSVVAQSAPAVAAAPQGHSLSALANSGLPLSLVYDKSASADQIAELLSQAPDVGIDCIKLCADSLPTSVTFGGPRLQVAADQLGVAPTDSAAQAKAMRELRKRGVTDLELRLEAEHLHGDQNVALQSLRHMASKVKDERMQLTLAVYPQGLNAAQLEQVSHLASRLRVRTLAVYEQAGQALQAGQVSALASALTSFTQLQVQVSANTDVSAIQQAGANRLCVAG